jgi:hypothetical protein
MKKLINGIAIVIVLVTAFLSCKKNDDNNNSGTTFNTSAIITQGTWKVVLFKDNNVDETSNYTGYQFTFTAGGAAAAISGSVVTNGTWNTFNDDSQNKLELKFGNTPPLDEITEDWHIIGASSSTIQMEHTSGGNGGTDYLTIQKM